VLDTKSPKYLEMAQGHISLSVAFGAIYAQVKKEKKTPKRISRSSKTSTSLRIRLATSPSRLAVVGLFTLATFLLCAR
jgi:hypothetical protein